MWEGEYDFAYLDETYQFSDTVNIDVHAASKDIKKTFRFRSSEPSENLIMTARTVKEVADILQLLQRLPEMPSAESSPLFNQG